MTHHPYIRMAPGAEKDPFFRPWLSYESCYPVHGMVIRDRVPTVTAETGYPHLLMDTPLPILDRAAKPPPQFPVTDNTPFLRR